MMLIFIVVVKWYSLALMVQDLYPLVNRAFPVSFCLCRVVSCRIVSARQTPFRFSGPTRFVDVPLAVSQGGI